MKKLIYTLLIGSLLSACSNTMQPTSFVAFGGEMIHKSDSA